MKKKGVRGQGTKVGSLPPGLWEILEEGLKKRRGEAGRIVSLQRQPLHSRSTHPIDRLNVELYDGEKLPVIFKRFTGKNEEKGSRREVLIYQRLLAGERFGSPRLYASLYNENQNHYWLFLEDVGEWTLNKGDKDDWIEAVRWLADMHGQFLGKEEELKSLDCLSRQDRNFFLMLAGDARRNLEMAGNKSALDHFDNLMNDYEGLLEELVQIPRTLVHGDIFPNNIMVQDGHRIRPIDWEGAAIGPPALDLVRLLDGWGSDKGFYIRHYWNFLKNSPRLPLAKPDFLNSLKQCELLNELWTLGWEMKACKDKSFVDEALRRIKTIWKKIPPKGIHAKKSAAKYG
jgi:thiamine kinase-like enzyme